jgi:hypothetical protein
LSVGAVHRYSAADEPFTLGERVFMRGPLLSRGTTRIGPGIAVDELEVTVSAGDAVQLNGLPLTRFITGGGLDGARLVLERIFSAGPGQPWVGALALFCGRIGTVEGGAMPSACRCAATPSCWTRRRRGTCTSPAA